jgi:hypothetical protein
MASLSLSSAVVTTVEFSKMSVSGQSRRFWPARAMSVIHPIATEQQTLLDV